MLELGQMLGLVAAILLVVTIAAWVKLGRGPSLQPIDGRSTAKHAPAEFAAQLLALAFGLSALAALVAVIGWIDL